MGARNFCRRGWATDVAETIINIAILKDRNFSLPRRVLSVTQGANNAPMTAMTGGDFHPTTPRSLALFY